MLMLLMMMMMDGVMAALTWLILQIGTPDCAQRCFQRLCGGEVDQLQLDAGELK